MIYSILFFFINNSITEEDIPKIYKYCLRLLHIRQNKKYTNNNTTNRQTKITIKNNHEFQLSLNIHCRLLQHTLCIGATEWETDSTEKTTC